MFDEPYENSATPTKLPLARFELPLDGTPPREFALDLMNGEAYVSLAQGSVRALISSKRPILMLRVLGREAPAEWDARSLFVLPDLAKLGYHVTNPAPGREGATGISISGPGGVTCAIAAAQRAVPGGFDVAISVVTLAEDSDPLRAALDRTADALRIGYDFVRNEHVAAYLDAARGARVTIGDQELQTQYDLARHLLASGSRRGSPSMALQAVWGTDGALPPWKGDYHNDLNTQAAYSAYASANMLDSGLALVDHLWRILPRLREVARDVYGVEGAVLPGVMAIDGSPLGAVAAVLLVADERRVDGVDPVRAWRISGDDAFLRDRAYPWCSAIGTALVELAAVGADGSRRLPLSTSPELHDNSLDAWLTPDSNYDLALLRALFPTSRRWRARWATKRTRSVGRERSGELDDLVFDAGALAVAPGQPYAASHRHLSHALAILRSGSSRSRALTVTAPRSTPRWTRSSSTALRPGPDTASPGSRASPRAPADRRRRCVSCASTSARSRCATGSTRTGISRARDCRTTRAACSRSRATCRPMAAVNEMLLQSWGGVVRVFPAASVTWPDARFDWMRARGGFLVSARRAGGRTVEVRVHATLPGRLRLRDPFDGADVDWQNPRVARDGADWVVDLAPKEDLVGVRSEK